MEDKRSATEDLQEIERRHKEFAELVDSLFPDFFDRISNQFEGFIAKGLSDQEQLTSRLYVAARVAGIMLGKIESSAKDVLGVPEEAVEEQTKLFLQEGYQQPILRRSDDSPQPSPENEDKESL